MPDFAPTFGEDWRDVDVMEVGELWLKVWLGLRLTDAEASAAAAGWDGGIYRSWTDGDDVAVVLATAWDTPEDAREFADALEEWASSNEQVHVGDISVDGTRVNVAFASSEELLPVVSGTLGSV